MRVYEWRNKSQTIRSSDRQSEHVMKKRLMTTTTLTFFDKFYSFAIILVTSKRIEMQSYAYWVTIKDGKEHIESELVNFEHYANDEIVRLGSYGGRFSEGLVSNYGMMSSAYTNTLFYPNNWQEKLATCSQLRYVKLAQVDFRHIRYLYQYRREIEFLQKIKASNMAEEVYWHSQVDMRTINLTWLKKHKPFIRNTDKSFAEYELEQRIKKRQGSLVAGAERYLTFHDINKIPKGVGMVKFQHWVIKNSIHMATYFDYLHVLHDLGLNPDNNENLILPKSLQQAHDNAVQQLNELNREKERLENERLQQDYERSLVTRRRLEKELDGFVFLLPKELNDIITEGYQLHHCVGSSHYLKRHRTGDITILFVRKKEAPHTPYFTLEYRGNQIVQLRGKHNQSPDERLQAVAEEWLQQVTQHNPHDTSYVQEVA
ncbi:PcfJ domain-containing protein [Enterococcus sp. LJL90]